LRQDRQLEGPPTSPAAAYRERITGKQEVIGYDKKRASIFPLGDQSKERCPVFPFAFRRFQWSLEDPLTVQGPTEQRLEAFRRVRNQIAPKVRELVDLAYKEQTEGLHWQR